MSASAPSTKHIVSALMAALLVTAASSPADACSLATPTLVAGPLGTAFPSFSAERDEEVILPASTAFVLMENYGAAPEPTVIARNVDTGELIYGQPLLETTRHPERRMFRPEPMLEPGTQYEATHSYVLGRPWYFGTYQVGDLVDTEAPEAPDSIRGEVRFHPSRSGCTETSCPDMTTLTVAVAPSTDDHTPPHRLTYAVYLGYTAAEARAVQSPVTLEPGGLRGDEEIILRLWLDNADADRNVFVSVSAIDMSGNESLRSEPLQVNWASTGCSYRFGRLGAHPITFLLCAAGAWLARRRARRERSYGSCVAS